jgi:serine/threonine-protein kinase
MTCPACGAAAAADAVVCGRCGGEIPAQDSSDPLLGRVLDGRLRILARLGEGGFGLVYRAEQISVGREVAVKVLHAAHARDAHVVGRFRREARAACQLRDPHTVVTHDFGEAPDGTLYLVMEFLRGRTLLDLLRGGPLAIERAIDIADQICQSLAEAHAAGIVHRDIKVENVMVDARPHHADFAKVLDFGIAKIVEGEPGAEPRGRITRQGQTVGSVEGMPPEQLRGEALDGRTDLYAVGVLLYRMICGRAPFSGSPSAIISGHLEQAPPPLRAFRPDVPPAIEAVVLRCLAKDPAGRPASAQALRLELREALAGRSRPRAASPPTRLRTLAVLTAVAVAVAATAAAIALLRAQARRSPDARGGRASTPPAVRPAEEEALRPVGRAHEIFGYIPPDVASAVALDLDALRASALGPDLTWLIDPAAPLPLETVDRLALADGEHTLRLKGLRLAVDRSGARHFFALRTPLDRRAIELAFGVRRSAKAMRCHDAEYFHAGPGHLGFLANQVVFGAGREPICPAVSDRPLAATPAAASLLAHAGYAGKPGPSLIGYTRAPEREIAFVLDHPGGRARMRAAARPSDCADATAVRDTLALGWRAPPQTRTAPTTDRICLLIFHAGGQLSR